MNGGMPAFGELFGAVLHPLVIATTLIWGVINGTKVLLFLSLLMSGFAIWWFAKELGVSRFSRIWIVLIWRGGWTYHRQTGVGEYYPCLVHGICLYGLSDDPSVE